MTNVQARFGIYLPGGSLQDELTETKHSYRNGPATSEAPAPLSDVVLVDHRGNPILIRRPRSVGFGVPRG